MNTEFQNLPNVVSPKEVQTYFGISRSTTYRIFHDATFRRSTLETDCWCGGMSYWTGWNGKRSIKPKTRTRRLSGLMNSFVAVPVVVFVSRKETMQRERHIPKSPAPWAQRGQHPSANRRAVGGAAICRNRLQDRQTQAHIHLLQHAVRGNRNPAAASPRSPHTGLA